MTQSAHSKILIVIHGKDRGRWVPTGQEFQRHLRSLAPDIMQRVHLHETGNPVPNLSNFGLVMFWLGDPLKAAYPQCYAEAVILSETAQKLAIPVINPPRVLDNTLKSKQAEIWRKVGLPCQRIFPVNAPEVLVDALAETTYPCIVRSNRDHAQGAIKIVRSAAQAASLSFDPNQTSAVIPMIDIRAAYRAHSDQSLFARFHHKARAIVAGDDVIASHLFFSKSPIVCQHTSLFNREARSRRKAAREYGFRRELFRTLIAADLDYFNRPVAHADLLRQSVQALGLGFAAVDYSFLPDGGIMLWEANPYFSLDHGRYSILSAERNAVERVNQTYERLVSAFVDVAARNARIAA